MVRLAVLVLGVALLAPTGPALANWAFETPRGQGPTASLRSTQGERLAMACIDGTIRFVFRPEPVSQADLRRRGLTEPPNLETVRFIVETERGYRFARTAARQTDQRGRDARWVSSEPLTTAEVEALGAARRMVVIIEPRMRQFFKQHQGLYDMGAGTPGAVDRVNARGACPPVVQQSNTAAR
jgi:hypothetical protein